MTPHEFIAKWRNNELKERSASQSHFNDLCALLGVVDPITADPAGEWFTFEKGASKTSGGEGWADVWRKACFAWEYKGPKKDLKKAFDQLLQYSVALENPPLLIVSDMNRIRIHTNWTNTVQEVHDFELDDLIDGDVRERLKRAFTDPEHFKPSKTRQALTEETAKEFAGLAQRLRDRGHDAGQVAHFVNQLVFCMFAEDVGLLPDNLFTKMLDLCRSDPASFAEHAGMLFGAMANQGGKVGFTRIDWFNGGLFADDYALPVTRDDVEDLYKAAQRDWSQIDPSILGTLFERGLDPAKRSQLGAHYTDRDKIMMIVRPVVIEPLEAEWAEALTKITALIDSAPKRTKDRLLTPAEKRRADKLRGEAAIIHQAFIERLVNFRVLDPACGSGNFLYVALRALKDLEHRANLDAESLGLPRGFPRVGPECVLGIELNPYAAELARVSVWIGEIQWMRRNGFDAAKNPILRNLDTIECRDAVLNADGTRAAWPVADAVVGNPPFLGDRKMGPELGVAYAERLRSAFRTEVRASADLVCFWFAQANVQIAANRLNRAGLVATNSIRGGANRAVLKRAAEQGSIFEAWSDEGWTVDGAAVRVSIVCFRGEKAEIAHLNGNAVAEIYPDLTGGGSVTNLTLAKRLGENVDIAFQGTISYGPFELPGSEARELLARPINPNGRPNSDIVKPWTNGQDVTKRPSDHWIIFFPDTMTSENAALYEAPWEIIEERVRPYRAEKPNEALNRHWWRLWRSRSELSAAVSALHRQLITPRVSKHRLFVWRSTGVVADSATVAIARDDDTSFGILHSVFHELWSLRMGTSLEDRPRYTPSTTFETFPFPEGLTPDIPAGDYASDPRAIAIAAAAARLNELRENWLNPANLVVREPEVVGGYPDRVLPKDEAAAKELAKRTLTNLYNARPAWLDNAHRALDEAVADAYGWGDDWRAGTLADDEILARLFILNQQRAAP
jgi:type II restriction/modification system DNA methylase subunit YeeA